MNEIVNVSRREFLCGSAALAFTLGVSYRSSAQAAKRSSTFAPDAFIRIAEDSSVLIVVGRSEMGQGVFTSLPMLIAEELDVEWSRVNVESAPTDPAFDNPAFGMQGTGGSSSIKSSWEPLRRAGATARAMLVQAAAQAWGVDARECRTFAGEVIHERTQRRLAYGVLVPLASNLSPPRDVALKSPDQYRLIGHDMPRLDLPAKMNGAAVFGIDVVVPGMLVAVIARPPRFGATAKSFDASRTLNVPGVRRALAVDAGIAVVADDFWSATKGREALQVEWHGGLAPTFDDHGQRAQYSALLQEPGVLVRARGEDIDAALSAAARRHVANFEFPYLAQTPMEPLNCVADVRSDSCEVWVGTQFQTYDREAAASAAGLKPEQVTLHTTLLGGGFGRRGVPDGHFVREAVQVSKAVGAPVKVIWTRSDDIQGGYYRPAYQHAISAGTDASGRITSWLHRVVGQSILTGTPFARNAVRNGADSSSTYISFYDVPNYRVELHTPQLQIPVWAWRSVGSTHNAFAIECFMDDLAFAAGEDPCLFRRPMLNPQRRAVLDLAMEKSNWGRPLPKGKGRGVAIHQFDCFVAQVAEVTIDSGSVRVDRVVCAVDCGTVVNPNIARAQIEGAIAMGLSAFVHEQITFKNGQVQQSNFADYQILRMAEMPRVEVHFVPSTSVPLGIGESGVPPIAPAVANAIFAATGQRIRKLPWRTPA